MYEDAGTDYEYEKGEFSKVVLSYNESRGELTIGARMGEFPGMVGKRVFKVRWIGDRAVNVLNFDAGGDATVEYSGAEVVVRRGGA